MSPQKLLRTESIITRKEKTAFVAYVYQMFDFANINIFRGGFVCESAQFVPQWVFDAVVMPFAYVIISVDHIPNM